MSVPFLLCKSFLANVRVGTRYISTALPDSWYKRLPPIDEKEIEEKAIKGSGPGGQAINKTHNCCQIKHIPTGKHARFTTDVISSSRIRIEEEKTDFHLLGIVVTCQQTRFLEQNRFLARRQLQEKLDFLLNGEQGLVAQYKREKSEKKDAKRIETKKNLERKRAFKSGQDSFTSATDDDDDQDVNQPSDKTIK